MKVCLYGSKSRVKHLVGVSAKLSFLFLLGVQVWGQGPSWTGPALVPMPREVQADGVIAIDGGLSVTAPGGGAEDEFTVEDLIDSLKERGVVGTKGGAGKSGVVLLRSNARMAADLLSKNHPLFSAEMQDEGYVLVTEGSVVYDIAATAAGLYYGAQTIKQLVVMRDGKATLQGVTARDWPAMKYRGISDDISRGPISMLEFQKHEVRVLSQFKINIYSPYMEVSLEHEKYPVQTPFGGAMTRADVAELVRYAALYHVTIVPEQEAFGHLHHALMFENLNALGETDRGSALAPEPSGSIELIKDWFGEMAAEFPGPFLHVGADEVNELGLGQSKDLIARDGSAKTYLNFVTQIHTRLQPLHKRLLFWGDIAMKEPELVKSLPKDMIAVAWEYGPHPDFAKWIKPFKDAGMETWVAPGINDWNRIYPNNDEGLRNIQGFVAEGQRQGSTGELNTVWNADEDDEGLFSNDWYGVLFGGAAGWQAGTSDIPQFQKSYGQVFHGDLTGKVDEAQMELTAAQLEFNKAGYLHGAMNDLFWVDPWSEQGQLASAKVLPYAHAIRLHAERAIVLLHEAEAAEPLLREKMALDAAELAARRIDFVGFRFLAAKEIQDKYTLAYKQQLGSKKVGNPLFHVDYLYQDLIYQLAQLHDRYEEQWLKQNRPYSLHAVMVRYDMNTQMWWQRSGKFLDAKQHFAQTGKVPPPEELGMPALAK